MESAGDGDVRVLGVDDQDTSMMDIGDRGRPPGDPPDPKGSWAEKVKSTSGGGMLAPELMMDDAYVSERLRVEFPNGERGEPVVTIEEDVLKRMNDMWKQCMIVKVLGRRIAIAALSRKLREMWRPQGAMYVMDLPRQFFMVRFEKEEEYLAALTGGPWKAFGSYLMVQAWSPEFDPTRDEILTTPVWIRLANIPVNFYHNSILMGIARGLGKPVRVDATTLSFERGRFARVCVEVNLAIPLKGTILINGERYSVTYEGLSTICSKCGLYGHLIHNCPSGVVEKSAALIESYGKASSNEDQQMEDGFTLVRRGGRRVMPVQPNVVFAAGGSDGGVNRNLREIPQTRGERIIEMTNRFENLGENIAGNQSREIILGREENKENAVLANVVGQGKSMGQGRNHMVSGSMEKGKKGGGNGPNSRRAGNNSNAENGRQRAKQNVAKPTKGLVFGPTRGDVELSASGKRLRVEMGNVGRVGGSFVANTESNGVKQVGSGPKEITDTSPSSGVRLDGVERHSSDPQMVNVDSNLA